MGKIFYQIIVLIILIFCRNGILVTLHGEIIIYIHGAIFRVCFIGEILYEFFEIFIPKIFETIKKDILHDLFNKKG